MKSKKMSAYEILNFYVKTSGYYEIEGVDQAKVHLNAIHEHDNILLEELPFITGKINIYSI
jgi:hypothetical protein